MNCSSWSEDERKGPSIQTRARGSHGSSANALNGGFMTSDVKSCCKTMSLDLGEPISGRLRMPVSLSVAFAFSSHFVTRFDHRDSSPSQLTQYRPYASITTPVSIFGTNLERTVTMRPVFSNSSCPSLISISSRLPAETCTRAYPISSYVEPPSSLD